MPRGFAATLLISVALIFPLAAPAAGGGQPAARAAAAAEPGSIILRARFHRGRWQRALSLSFAKLRLTDFTLCAIWNHPPGSAFDCTAAATRKLPEGTTMRLEQSPVGRALKKADSPGWGMLGSSPDGGLGAVLSNLVTGNRRGTFHYRVTLRDRTNHVLVTSNTLTVVWR